MYTRWALLFSNSNFLLTKVLREGNLFVKKKYPLLQIQLQPKMFGKLYFLQYAELQCQCFIELAFEFSVIVWEKADLYKSTEIEQNQRCILLIYINVISSKLIKTNCSKVPIFYFNGPKHPPDNCYVTCLPREKSALSKIDVCLCKKGYSDLYPPKEQMLRIKVSKSRKQFMVFSNLPKNKQNSLS
jgi:hypothetical protein